MPRRFRTATDFVVYVENALGWSPPISATAPLWRARAAEAGKLKKKMQTDPELYTFDNLVLAVNYCLQTGTEIKTPTGLCWIVPKALAMANAPVDPEALSTLVERAVALEQGRGPDDAGALWIQRLTRAHGEGLASVYEDWKRERS